MIPLLWLPNKDSFYSTRSTRAEGSGKMEKQLLMANNFPSNPLYTRLCNSLLLLSLLFNGLFLLLLPKHHQLSKSGATSNNLKIIGWSRKAAEEAEAAAVYNCSGHGYVFVDSLTPACECNDCYTGPGCSETVPNCVVDAEDGDTLFLEPYWIENAEMGTTVLPAWYRMSYRISDSVNIMISPELEKQIRAIHSLVGNAVTEGRYIVVGVGSTQLINAVVNSLSPTNARNPAEVVAASPYYGDYRDQTDLFESVDFKWKGEARNFIERTEYFNSTTFIEFVTSPNNPDSVLQKGVLKGENVKAVYDHAYYWPHFTAITRPAEDDSMLFTLSKLTGHAGSRLGWAIVKDYDLYQKIYLYVELNTMGVSHDTQLRATRLLKAVVSGYTESKRVRIRDEKETKLLFHYAYRVMRSRWQRLERIFRTTDRFSLQDLSAQYCNFFNKVTGPSPAYAWLKCAREEERECAEELRKRGIIGSGGEVFGSDKRYVRVSLLKRPDNFALLEHRLEDLVSSSASIRRELRNIAI